MAAGTSWKRKLAISFVSLVVFASIGYGISIVWRTRGLYDEVKSGWRGWTGKVHGSDPELGLRLVPNGRGAETFSIGPDVPSRVDAEGFRVPVDAPEASEKKRPIVLALGCSFTFGAACKAEDTFAWRTAQGLNGTCLNSGICSAGAAQMLILARRLIPEYKPDFVLAEYAPWLPARAADPFAQTNMGLIPTPYFVNTKSGIELHPPAFDTIAFDLPIAEYKQTPRGLGDFTSFLFRVGVPLLVHDDRHSWELSIARSLGSEPPIASYDQIAALVWPEIARLCRENGARMIVVWFDGRPMGESWDLPPVLAELGAHGVPIAHASEALIARLPEKTRPAYIQAYTHKRGDPPVCVDGHPNPLAHEIVAEEILRAIHEAR